jgi:hypothetical protein
MSSRKAPKRLFKTKDVVPTYQHERATKVSYKRMTREHLDVLQNIESALVACARHDSSIDDRLIDQALRVCIGQSEPREDGDIRVAALCRVLMQVRSTREDVSDDVWAAGLRTVDESVRDHSSLEPGETRYLDFVQNYVM